MADVIRKYGSEWSGNLTDIEIELQAVRRGGFWRNTLDGPWCGEGLLSHYRRAQKLLWPSDDHHRWSEMMLRSFLEESITVIFGGKDSSKTYSAAKFVLVDYWAFPDETLIMVSSTEMRGADYRIWGTLKDLLKRAKEIYEFLPGKVLEAKHAICTDDLENSEIRDPRKGLVFIPCFGSGGQWVGLSRYAGIKQKRRRLLGDEIQFMLNPYVDVLTNIKGGDFKGIFLGNPIGQGDPLDRLGEPEGGWGSEGEIKQTTSWRNKFGGKTICLYGPDSPNFDHPQKDGAKRYSYMIGQTDIDWVKKSYGEDSHTFWMQVMGVRRAGLTARRVITEMMCKQFGAFDHCVWSGSPTTLIAGLDAAYGGVGGDRCVLQVIEFGAVQVVPAYQPGVISIPMDGSAQSKMAIRCHLPIIVPVSVSNPTIPEDQIAEYCKKHCEGLGLSPSNFFFDGRGTLAMSLARIWSAQVNAVEFGGPASKRPVSLEHLIYDPVLQSKRPKRCDEEYSKFVTELWFSVRYVIESGQMRELPRDTMREGCQREWKMVARDRREVEPKSDMKERTNQSPDLFDALATAVEGARRRGFHVEKISNFEAAPGSQDWIDQMARKSKELRRAKELDFTAS